MLARAVIVGGIALIAALQVVRTAVASAFVAEQPELAERIWPSHPQVNFALAMAEIGRGAAAGKRIVPDSTLRRVERASNHAPLAAEPFLIKGAIAKTAGREGLAERLFVEARKRNPRSAAARYFLAERYFSSGRETQGLNEVSALVRLVPSGSPMVVPGLAKYARTPGAVPHLQRMFAANPEVGDAVLTELASDAANAALIMQLAGPIEPRASVAPSPAWQGRLLNALIERGDFDEARGLWGRISGVTASTPPALFNKGFAKNPAPPPFNWTFASASYGVAEPAAGAKLNVIFYGRDDADLASQLLVLRAGQYRITMVAAGEAARPSGLEWSVTCLPSNAKLLGIPLRGMTLTGTRQSGTFTVPGQGCAAQWLKLKGTATEIAESEQVTIAQLELLPVAAQ